MLQDHKKTVITEMTDGTVVACIVPGPPFLINDCTKYFPVSYYS